MRDCDTNAERGPSCTCRWMLTSWTRRSDNVAALNAARYRAFDAQQGKQAALAFDGPAYRVSSQDTGRAARKHAGADCAEGRCLRRPSWDSDPAALKQECVCWGEVDEARFRIFEGSVPIAGAQRQHIQQEADRFRPGAPADTVRPLWHPSPVRRD